MGMTDTYYRTMRAGPDGSPLCGDSATRLGVRDRDVVVDPGGFVQPKRGGMSVTPDDPRHLPEEFLPESLGGLGRIPLYSVQGMQLRSEFAVRPDPQKPKTHAFVEPASPIPLEDFRAALCLSAPKWRRYEP
jgi:hypothetical protein